MHSPAIQSNVWTCNGKAAATFLITTTYFMFQPPLQPQIFGPGWPYIYVQVPHSHTCSVISVITTHIIRCYYQDASNTFTRPAQHLHKYMYGVLVLADHEVSQILFDQGVDDISVSSDALIAGFAVRLTILYSMCVQNGKILQPSLENSNHTCSMNRVHTQQYWWFIEASACSL